MSDARLRRAAVTGLLVCIAGVAAGVSPRISRASLQGLERNSDLSFESLLKEDPMAILGSTRAVYLDNYGVVFSAEVELAPRLTPNPFRPQFTKQDIARNKESKRARAALLKDHMRTMLMNYASNLETVPLSENVALAVTIPYSRMEDAAGMPKQIVMAAPRRALLDAKAGSPEPLNAALKVQEYF